MKRIVKKIVPKLLSENYLKKLSFDKRDQRAWLLESHLRLYEKYNELKGVQN